MRVGDIKKSLKFILGNNITPSTFWKKVQVVFIDLSSANNIVEWHETMVTKVQIFYFLSTTIFYN